MNALLVAMSLAVVSPSPSPVARPASPASPSSCAGVLDRTATCPALDDVKTAVLEDPKPDAAAAAAVETNGFPIDKMPNELAFASTLLALAGGGAIAASFAKEPVDDDERLLRDVTRGTGIGLLVWSGMAATGAIALFVFNPATGELRPKLFGENE